MLEVNNFDYLNLFILTLCLLRIYLEIIDFDFNKLPITNKLSAYYGKAYAQRFHKFGFYMGAGYFLLNLPNLLTGNI